MCRSVATLVGRSVATLVGRNAIWVGVFTEQGGEVGARGDSRSRKRFTGAGRKEWKTRGDSRSREVRLEHGGFTEQGERSGEHGNLNGGRLEDALLFYLSMLL